MCATSGCRRRDRRDFSPPPSRFPGTGFPFNAKFIAEGGIWTADDLKRVLGFGVETVVIGTSITRPQKITERFVGVFGNKKAGA